jgi:hypothetical protein
MFLVILSTALTAFIFSDLNYKMVIFLSQNESTPKQGRPLGGASGALAPGADFEGAPKRRSPTGHTLIRSTLAWRFPHLQTKRVTKDFF